MKASMERLLMRCLYLILSIPLIGLMYGPSAGLPNDLAAIRWLFALVLLLSGIWVWNSSLIKESQEMSSEENGSL